MRAWVWGVMATAVTVVGGVLMWRLAAPRGSGGICPSILPAPAGCSDSRIPVAIVWSAIVAGLYAANLAVWLPRLRRYRWLPAVALVTLAVAAVVGYRSVLYS